MERTQTNLQTNPINDFSWESCGNFIKNEKVKTICKIAARIFGLLAIVSMAGVIGAAAVFSFTEIAIMSVAFLVFSVAASIFQWRKETLDARSDVFICNSKQFAEALDLCDHENLEALGELSFAEVPIIECQNFKQFQWEFPDVFYHFRMTLESYQVKDASIFVYFLELAEKEASLLPAYREFIKASKAAQKKNRKILKENKIPTLGMKHNVILHRTLVDIQDIISRISLYSNNPKKTKNLLKFFLHYFDLSYASNLQIHTDTMGACLRKHVHPRDYIFIHEAQKTAKAIQRIEKKEDYAPAKMDYLKKTQGYTSRGNSYLLQTANWKLHKDFSPDSRAAALPDLTFLGDLDSVKEAQIADFIALCHAELSNYPDWCYELEVENLPEKIEEFLQKKLDWISPDDKSRLLEEIVIYSQPILPVIRTVGFQNRAATHKKEVHVELDLAFLGAPSKKQREQIADFLLACDNHFFHHPDWIKGLDVAKLPIEVDNIFKEIDWLSPKQKEKLLQKAVLFSHQMLHGMLKGLSDLNYEIAKTSPTKHEEQEIL